MKNNNNSNQIKTIAVVAPTEKRKEVIEWSYFNRHALSKYDLVATSNTARILEGTINKPVFSLPLDKAGGYSLMATMMLENKVDVIFFFGNPMKNGEGSDSARQLLDIALDMNIVIAGNQSKMF